MYTVLRNLHLAAGVFSSVFLIAYAISAAQMAYPIYDPPSTETVTQISVPESVDIDARSFARWLMDEHGLRGELDRVDVADHFIALTITRVGTSHRIEYHRRSRTARITTVVENAIGMLNRVHHVGGVGHDYWARNAWGWLLLAVSLSVLLLAVTGVVMWFQRHRERRLGALVLTAGLVWGVTLLILVRTA